MLITETALRDQRSSCHWTLACRWNLGKDRKDLFPSKPLFSF